MEAPSIALRLFLLAAQIADECGFEDLAYDLYVSAFSVYEDSISESRAQLQAITLIIGTLQGARVFSEDNYDTLITKAALHGARLLKKPHQATAVNLASHLWWQDVPADEEVPPKESQPTTPADDGAENVKKAVSSLRSDPSANHSSAMHSTRIKTASAFWNAFKRRCELQAQRSRRLSQYSFTATPSISTCITSIVGHRL